MEPHAAATSGATSASATRGNHPAIAWYSLVTMRGPALTYRLLLAAVLQLAACHAAAAEPDGRPVRVALDPRFVERLSGVAWRSMTQESTGIWAREGIALSWSGPVDGADLVLSVVFDDRAVRKHDTRNEDAFGVTLFAGREQRILVSVSRAREVVARRSGLADSSDAMTLDIAMGVVLGRVVAHEIGHALLLTLSHATHGLMNPRIETADLRPLPAGQLALLAPDRHRLTVRFSNRPASVQMTNAEFTWTDVPPAPSPQRARR
jgi:hypothetical protein